MPALMTPLSSFQPTEAAGELDSLPSQALLAREVQLREGATPAALQNPLAAGPLYWITADAFLLQLPSGLRFHYQRGAGVVFSRPAGVPDAEVSLFHSGSVYGAVVWLNGLIPLHASAVVHDGQVHAFTGQSGAGKSTLSAALSQRGLAMFADDVLVLDLSNPAQPMAFQGHKRLKLWAESLDLVGLDGGDRVRSSIDKYYVEPPLLQRGAALPFGHLYALAHATSGEPALRRLSGAERFSMMRGAFCRPLYGAAVLRPADIHGIVSRLQSQVGLQVFDRSRARDRFDSNADFLAAAIRASHG